MTFNVDDIDYDGMNNDVDLDDDGNGLNEIRTADDLDAVRANLSADYELDADIDLVDRANWQPLGDVSNPFTGVFDGNGYNHRESEYQRL